VLVLNTHDTTSPGSSECFVIVEQSSEVLGKYFKILEIFLLDFSKGNAGSSLLVNELSESCLSLDESVGNSLLSAESWEEDEQFNGVNIVSHNDELCLSFFNQLGNVVETELQDNWLGGLLSISTSSFLFSFLLKSCLLFFVSFWLIL